MARYWIVPLGAAAALTLAILASGWPYRPLLAWLLAANAVGLAMTVYDKRVAGTGRTRVPESVLHGLAALGGWPSQLLAMRLTHHKTGPRSRRFRAAFGLAVAANVAALGGLVMWRH